MGLACAHHLGRRGARVTLFEAGPVLGGMSAAFDFGGLSIERFFHFLCRTDHDYVALLEELGTQPRTTYLAKIKNPNPALQGQQPEGE